ncbi:MAG: aldo/keto reductase [Clostridiales bacterium]|nr:aldo/keto reductase [Clostridiales bacterium]
MIYSDFGKEKLSLLGFGAMRLPLIPDDPSGLVDEVQVEVMIEYAMEHGVNYFDTAYPYHGGQSERVLGRILKKYPRDRFYLATKYPGHQISSSYHPEEVFEEQLKNCQVDYFDFYLLHNVYEESLKVYTDPQWGIIDYFMEQKRQGRIHYLGFSTHFLAENLGGFLERYGDCMDFCQIQLNYMDWTLQSAEEKYKMLEEYHLPIWVMEPLRGGKLAVLSEADEAVLKRMRPDESSAAWAFRWLQGLSQVKMILSGMSDLNQMMDNVSTFEVRKPLSQAEEAALYRIAEGMKNSVPCTACRYCCDTCPAGLDIPFLLKCYNESRFLASINLGMTIESMPEDKRPDACLGCGKCAKQCPQKIDIPGALQDFAGILSKLPSWEAVCREREEANRRAQASE